MADPKDPQQAPKPSPELLSEMERLRTDNGPILSQDPAVARRAAQAEIESLARRAIDWKKARGVYPWEEPESAEEKKIAAEQKAWAKEVGIDPDKAAGEFLGRVKEAIHRIEAQKKTDVRGR